MGGTRLAELDLWAERDDLNKRHSWQLAYSELPESEKTTTQAMATLKRLWHWVKGL